MRKAKPVIVLLAIQLFVALAIALFNPVKDAIIRAKGTEYTFATQETFLTGDFTEYVNTDCHIKYGFNYDRFGYSPEEYAVIKTDENGLAYISELSFFPPENGDYLGTENKPHTWFSFYSKELDFELYEKACSSSSLFSGMEFNLSQEYEITVNVSVYKGEAVMNAILVNGVEIEEFINNL